MPVDTSAILGFKQPDQMQNLSSLVNMAKGAQDLQRSQQQTESEGIALQEKKHIQSVLSDPASYTNEDGTVDFRRAMPLIMRGAPTSGMQWVQKLAEAQDSHTKALQSLNALTSDNRMAFGSVLAGIKPGSPPDLVTKTIDSLGGLYKGSGPLVASIKKGYDDAKQGGQKAVDEYLTRVSRSVLPQQTQQAMNTPTIAPVNNNQQTYGVNIKPDVDGMPLGAEVPGTRTQIQLPPTTPVVGPNNQPGYLGPQPGVKGQFTGNPEEIAAAIAQIKNPQERANAQAAFEEQARRTPGFAEGKSFVPSGPVPGANEAKLGSIQTVNQHWDGLNKQSENSQLLEGLLGNIKSLAPGAITGTESGRKAYITGLLNALHLGNQATGDLQKDTDLLEKNIAQLGLGTPATTDAMRTIVSAARPHSTMSQGAIEEAAAQVTGQIQANRAVRNALVAPKQIASQTGDPSVYETVRTHLESIADPRAWQFQALPSKEAKAAMLSKLTPEDRAALRSKIEQLHTMGLLK